MKALVFNIRTNSLYSIVIPFTWHSALTYPVLPPSAVIGLLANALQRYKDNNHPLEYLERVEKRLLWAGSRLRSPCVIKSYTTSAIVRWENVIGGKFTNALGRQFAYARQLEVAAIFKDDTLLSDLLEAVKTTPLTCGDSEAPISLEGEVLITDVSEPSVNDVITTYYPIPYKKDTQIEQGNGQVYLMHERCLKKSKEFPLVSYLVPIKEERGIIRPSSLTVRITTEKVLEVSGVGFVLRRNADQNGYS